MTLENENRDRLRTALKAFVSFRIVFLGVMAFSAWILTKFYQDPPPEALWNLMTLGLSFSAVSLIAYASAKFFGAAEWKIKAAVVWAQLVWDLWASTVLGLASGGVAAAVTLLYSLYILMSAAILYVPGAVMASLLAIGFFVYGLWRQVGWDVLRDSRELSKDLLIISLLALAGGILALAARNRQRIYDLLNRTKSDFDNLNRLHSAIIEHIPSGLMVIDQTTSRISLVNEASYKILGENWMGRYLNDSPLSFLTSEGIRSESVAILSGRERTIGHSRTDLPGRKALIIFQDLTDIRDLESKMQLNDRLASVGQLAAGIAHEIRNPLASLSGSVQLLKHEIPQDSNPEKLMKIVLRETDRLDALIKNFLNYAKPSTLKLEKVHVKKIASEILELIKNHRALDLSQIELQLGLEDDLWIVCDQAQMRQILWNLILNAVDALEGCGVLKINAKEFSRDRDEIVHLEVSDSGSGIPEHLISRVFDPFFTTKAEGTGLGLALVYQMVKAHGGQIGIESKPKEGTKVWLELIKNGPKLSEVRAA